MGSCYSKIPKTISPVSTNKTSQINQSLLSSTSFREKKCKLSYTYELGRVLGRGSFGKVREVIHKPTGERRALKVIKKELYGPSHYHLFLSEIEILKCLDHPNIIKYIENFEDEDNLYIILEICDGQELFQKLMINKNFTEAESIKIMKQLLLAVSYMHENCILHRDIKPENILFKSIGAQSDIKLIDFGTAMKFSKNFITESIGTLYYAAPEVLEFKYNEKCDVWSCGVIAYLMLSGTVPFSGKDSDEIKKNIRKFNLEFDPEVWRPYSKSAENFIRKLLCPSKFRLTAAEALQDPWILSIAAYDDISSNKDINILASTNMFIQTITNSE